MCLATRAGIVKIGTAVSLHQSPNHSPVTEQTRVVPRGGNSPRSRVISFRQCTTRALLPGQECTELIPLGKRITDPGIVAATCSNYLCPDTLACVHFPHHCPCPFPEVEDKVELGEGIAVCVSKGGYKVGEAARKVELARKGLI